MKTNPAIPWWVIALCLATLFVGIGGREPWTPDEPRETAIAAAMARGEGFLLPRLGGTPFVEKPPLYYWLAALAMRALSPPAGEATAARSLSALCAGLTLLLTWAAGRAGREREFGTAAFAVLATAFGFFRAGHWIIIDPLLMLFTSAAVLLLFRGLSGGRPLEVLAGFLAAGLAFLTKGFVAWALLLFPWGFLFLAYSRQIFRRPLLAAAAVLLLLGPPATWMAAFRITAGPELWRQWFLDNQIGRFSGESAHLGHIKGPFYYLWLAPLLLPWTPALLGGIFRRRGTVETRPNSGRGNLIRLAAAWGLGGLLILSLSSTKREVYFYPLLPAFALLAAAALERLPRWSGTVLSSLAAIFGSTIIFFAFAIPRWTGEKFYLEAGFAPMTAVLGAAAVWAFLRLRGRPTARTAAIAALFYLAAGRAAPPVLNRIWSYRDMTETLTAAIPPESRDRVGLLGLDETTQAVFYYYAGITLPNLRDPERARKILEGKDREFNLIVVPRWEDFEQTLGDPPPYRVAARARKGPRRVFYLIGPPEGNSAAPTGGPVNPRK